MKLFNHTAMCTCGRKKLYKTFSFNAVRLNSLLAATALFVLTGLNSAAQNSQPKQLTEQWAHFQSSPEMIRFYNTLDIHNSGGHLQGIQGLQTPSGSYFILTGSSGLYSYYAVVKQGNRNEVVAVNRLMEQPFKHAGGFQIFQNYMAVGIEDNDAKSQSKICIYDLSEPEKPLAPPVAVIERKGAEFRSTAGCVGMTEYEDKILLAVGDWDTRNIDFYACKAAGFPGGEFRLTYSLNAETFFKKEGLDDHWLPWQNINLFTINDELFLVGLGQNQTGENIATLFRVDENNTGGFDLEKRASQSFACTSECSFKAGAGVVFDSGGNPVVLACGYNIEEVSVINRFETEPAENRMWPAHAHNDYEHDRPLFDALKNGFKSIEADVFSVGDSLFVAHDFDKIQPGRTLRKLYLDPLKKEIEKNNGSVDGDAEEVILLVDIKDDGLKTYRVLHEILGEYKPVLTAFENGKKKPGAVMVVVSGNRPFEFMQTQTTRYAGYDGRLENLDSGISPALMPMVSDNWVKFFTWDGTGQMPENEKTKLNQLAEKARKNAYILRFWGTPNATHEQRIAVWTELKKAGVGLIGADHLSELNEFFCEGN
jgi:hypothetical protein